MTRISSRPAENALDLLAVEGLADLAPEVGHGEAELPGLRLDAQLDLVAAVIERIADIEDSFVGGQVLAHFGGGAVEALDVGRR